MKNLDKFLGKTISSVSLTDNKVKFIFTDNTIMLLCDTDQQCCENRYFTTDDDLSEYSDSVLYNVIIKDCIYKNEYYPEEDNSNRDVQFLEVITNHGSITFASHNEHNGYYSGFNIEVIC